MYAVYCPKCGHMYYSNKIFHYCRRCRSILKAAAGGMKPVSAMSLNERYRLAYLLTKQ